MTDAPTSNRKAELLKLDICFEEGVSADHKVNQTLGDQLLEFRLLARRSAPRDGKACRRARRNCRRRLQ